MEVKQIEALRVLVVDDDALVLAVARRVLDRAGYRVSVFEDAARAIDELAVERPFAVVADLNMPGVDGTELLQRVASLSPESFRVLYTGEGQASELALPPGLAHAVVSKMAGPRALPETLDALRHRPRE